MTVIGTMKKILFVILIVCALVGSHQSNHQHHPKFPHHSREIPYLRKESCSQEHEDYRNEIIKKSKCGEPKEIFIPLTAATHEIVLPKAVWVKRCAGLCDYDGHSCVATNSVTRHIPVRVSNLRTDKEYCSTYAVEEHLSCGCCNLSQDDCESPKVFSPRKCSCQCPNVEERRLCLSKRNQNMKWNRFNCTCDVDSKT